MANNSYRKYSHPPIDSSLDHYEVYLSPFNSKTKKNLPYDCVFRTFYSKKDAMKFLEDNANPTDVFSLEFTGSPHSRNKHYIQNGCVLGSSFHNPSEKEIYLSTYKEPR